MVNFLAFYGAVLSTLLAAAKIIPEWPVITLDRAIPDPDPGVIHVRIPNPTKRALFVEGNTQFRANPLRIAVEQPLNRRADIQTAYEEHLKARRVIPRLCVPAEAVGLLRVSGIEEVKPARLIVLWWHRSWLLRWKLPAWVWVSDPLALMVNRASTSAQ
jgi:hypothetical protein